MLICRDFWTSANNYDIVDLTLHGGGQGFDSPRLHSGNVLNERGFSFSRT